MELYKMSASDYSKLSMAEFKGKALAKLEAIEESVKNIKSEVKATNKRVDVVENFQANLTGKFTVIGTVVILLVNFAWGFVSDIISKVKIK